MENASKAILIAGGVLVAIIVISIAVYIFSMGTSAFSSIEKNKAIAMKEEQDIKFSQYVGTVYGSEVQNCIRRVIQYNQANATNIAVTIEGVNGLPKDRSVPITTNPPTYSNFLDIIDNNGKERPIITALLRNDLFTGSLSVDADGFINQIKFRMKTPN